GFLFYPHKQCKSVLSEVEFAANLKRTILFVVYGAVLLGIVFVFWTFIPERLYYTVPYIDFNQLTFIELSTPLTLFILFSVGFILVMGIYFVIVGTGNYIIEALLSKRKITKSGYKDYLTLHGYSILPLLLLGVFTIFWIYFFEKLYFTQTIAPFIDFTRPMILFFTIFFIFLGWQWFVELRINQAFFNISIIRAIIPELVQVAMFWGFYVLLQVVINMFTGNMQWV
ncbi:MAG: hypothetical protein ACTSQQ_07140, partial [Candidatus Helarchaeota archaeon]